MPRQANQKSSLFRRRCTIKTINEQQQQQQQPMLNKSGKHAKEILENLAKKIKQNRIESKLKLK